MKELKEREKMPALRISEDAILTARNKFGDGTLEREFFETVLLARIPYALISRLSGIDHNSARDMITGRKAYTPDARDVFGKLNRLFNAGVDAGIYPCSDLAVIEPVTNVLLSQMATAKRYEIAKAKLVELGVLPQSPQ